MKARSARSRTGSHRECREATVAGSSRRRREQADGGDGNDGFGQIAHVHGQVRGQQVDAQTDRGRIGRGGTAGVTGQREAGPPQGRIRAVGDRDQNVVARLLDTAGDIRIERDGDPLIGVGVVDEARRERSSVRVTPALVQNFVSVSESTSCPDVLNTLNWPLTMTATRPSPSCRQDQAGPFRQAGQLVAPVTFLATWSVSSIVTVAAKLVLGLFAISTPTPVGAALVGTLSEAFSNWMKKFCVAGVAWGRCRWSGYRSSARSCRPGR